MIPTHPTTTWFNSLESIINQFYWKNKTPRIKLITLQKPKITRRIRCTKFHLLLSGKSITVHIQMDTPKSLRSHLVRHRTDTLQKHSDFRHSISQSINQTTAMFQSNNNSICSDSLVEIIQNHRYHSLTIQLHPHLE